MKPLEWQEDLLDDNKTTTLHVGQKMMQGQTQNGSKKFDERLLIPINLVLLTAPLPYIRSSMMRKLVRHIRFYYF